MPTPNEYGVYSKADAETLILPRTSGPRHVMPLAEIALLELDQGWIAAAAFQTFGASCLGRSSPLTAHRLHPSREAALSHEIAQMRRTAEAQESDDFCKILRWLDQLNPTQMRLF